MASNDPLPNTQVVVEPKAKKTYKTKMKEEKNIAMKEQVIIAQTMVGGEASWWEDLKFKGIGGRGGTTCSTKIQKTKVGWRGFEQNKGPWKDSLPCQAKERNGQGERGSTNKNSHNSPKA